MILQLDESKRKEYKRSKKTCEYGEVYFGLIETKSKGQRFYEAILNNMEKDLKLEYNLWRDLDEYTKKSWTDLFDNPYPDELVKRAAKWKQDLYYSIKNGQ